MPTFLSDPSPVLYLVLAVLVFITGAVWFNRRDRKSLAVFLGCIAIAAAVFLLDHFFESPREEAVRRVLAMARAADARQPEEFVAHIADRVEYQGGSANPVTLTREQIRNHGFWHLLNQFQPHIAAWDFARADVREISADSVEIGFLAKGEAQGPPFPVYFRATFTRQADGQYKLTRFASFDPMKRQNSPLQLPGFGSGSP